MGSRWPSHEPGPRPFGSDWVGGAIPMALSSGGLGPAPVLPPPGPVTLPVPKVGSFAAPAGPPSRDIELEPAHFHSLMRFVRGADQRLRSVANRLQRQCLRSALSQWRDSAQHEVLDNRLQKASSELRTSAAKAKAEQRPQEVLALEQRLQAVKRARAESQGAYRLSKVLQDMRWRRLVAGIARWKDTTLIRPEERRMIHALHGTEDLASCPSQRWRLFGGSEEELHAILQEWTGTLHTQAKAKHKRAENYRILARRLRNALVSQQERLIWDALDELKYATPLPRVARGEIASYPISSPERSPQMQDFSEMETESWGGDSATFRGHPRNADLRLGMGGSPPWLWAHMEEDGVDGDALSDSPSWASVQDLEAAIAKSAALRAMEAKQKEVGEAAEVARSQEQAIYSRSTLPFVTASSVESSPSAWHMASPTSASSRCMATQSAPACGSTSFPAPVPPAPRQSGSVVAPELVAGHAARAHVTIFGASGLKHLADLAANPDSFCVCKSHGSRDPELRSQVVPNSTEPHWNYEGIIDDYVGGQTLEFTVMEEGAGLKDDPLGVAILKWPDASRVSGYDGELNLTGPGVNPGALLRVRVAVTPPGVSLPMAVSRPGVVEQPVPPFAPTAAPRISLSQSSAPSMVAAAGPSIYGAPARAIVKVVGASNLPQVGEGAYHKNPDPFCLCRVPSRPQSAFQTQVFSEDCNPVWNYEHTLTDYGTGEPLEFVVVDDSSKGQHELGRAVLDWPDPSRQHGFNGALPLQTTDLQFGDATLQVEVKVEALGGASASSPYQRGSSALRGLTMSSSSPTVGSCPNTRSMSAYSQSSAASRQSLQSAQPPLPPSLSQFPQASRASSSEISSDEASAMQPPYTQTTSRTSFSSSAPPVASARE